MDGLGRLEGGVLAALCAGSFVAGALSLPAQADPPTGCEYLALSSPQNRPVVVAHLVNAGCVAQCVGKVFCLSEGQAKMGSNYQFSSLDKLMYSKSVACDANSDGTCPLPADCTAAASAPPSRIATEGKISAAGAAKAPDNHNYQYGYTYNSPATAVSIYAFPQSPSSVTPQALARCASTTWSMTSATNTCGLASPGVCMSANSCAAAEPTSSPITADQVHRMDPSTGATPAPGSGGALAPGH